VTSPLLAPAEEPGLWTPPGRATRLVRGDGFTLVARHARGTVEGVRLAPGAVAEAVEEARDLARALGITELVWWTGELSRPSGLLDELEDAGLVPYPDEPSLTTLTIDRPPARPDGVVVRGVDDLAVYREAMELDWEVWKVPEADRERRRLTAAADWDEARGHDTVVHHLAVVEGRPAGFSRLVLTGAAGVLMGGAVLPWARGRGAYRALVHARWESSAGRGVPRLVTSAGAMSAPVLTRLGFTTIGTVRLMLDPRL